MVEAAYKPNRTGLADVDAKLFRAAHVCASTEAVRYYINGVYITHHPQGGVLLIATDGHRMMVIRDNTGWCKRPVIVQLERAGLKACEPTKAVIEPRVVVDAKESARVGNSYVSPNKVIVDGTYPDWRRVVPVKKWKLGTASFNGEYIGAFGKIAKMLGSQQSCIRIMCDESGSSAALIIFPHEFDAFGILMPMRADVPAGGLPPWMMSVMAVKEKKPEHAKAKRVAKKK